MSYTISKILVPVDFSETSETALSQATSMAQLLNATLYLVYVIDPREYYLLEAPELLVALPTAEDIEKHAVKRLKDLQTTIKNNSGKEPVVELLTGDIHHSIVDYATEKGVELIVMGTHGASGSKELFLGSNAQKVVTLSLIPVLTLQKDRSGFKSILIPLDNSTHSRAKVNIAATLAEIYHSTVHILGLPDSDDAVELNKFRIKVKSVEDVMLAKKLKVISGVAHGESLADVALDYTEKNHCDLIVINTGHESKISGIFLGAFAQQIVNHSKFPVLSVRPNEDTFIYFSDLPGFGIG